MSTELDKIVEEMYSAYSDVEESTENFTSYVDDINTFNNLFEGYVDYTYATGEEKEQAKIQIMQSYFTFGEKLPDTMGGWSFEIGSFLLDEGLDIIEPSDEKYRLLKKHLTLDPNSNEAIQIENIIDHFDEYWNKKSQIIQIAKHKSEWDKFYESYQENNDLGEIYKNVTDIFDDGLSAASDALGFMDETTPHGQLAKEMSEAFFKGIENWEDGAEIIADDVEKFCDDWSTGMKFIGNMITNAFTKKAKASATKASTKRADPFILDLDGDGFNVETKENGVNFDLDKNGFAEKINWTSRDGFLCLDLNNNGTIDDGGELFGDKTLLANGTEATNGFEALAQYDSNSDGVIDANDEIYSSLRVWVDGNGDGISAGGELKTLADLGITSINLAYENVNAETGTEATIGNSATFTYADGTVGNAGELWVSSDLFDTVDKVDIEIPDDIKELANVGSIGNVYSLHNAMALDETGELKALVESFAAEQDMDKRMELTEQILFFITGANEVENGSRGSFMNAKKLAVIEAMLGEDYVGTTGKNPNSAAAPLLKEAYADLLDMYYNELAAQTYIKDYVQLLRYTENEDGTKVLNADLVNYVLEYQLANGDENAKGILADVARYVQYLDNGGIKGMSAFLANYAAVSTEYAAIIGGLISNCEFADGVNPFEGSSSAELILGTDNEDTIYGYSGNDIFIGGKGDDYLNGAAGNDTYIFNVGDGNDIIEESNYNKKDKIVFGEGVSAENLIVERNGDNLVLKYGEGDSVTVTEHFKARASNIEFIEFADGVTWNIDDIIDKANDIYGTADDDKLYGYSSNSSYDYNELFSAGDGNDEIYGYSGNDTLIGGKGNDYLNGGNDNDTYIFNIGDGNDVIEDYQVNTSYGRDDKLIFGDGISIDDVVFSKSGNDLLITFTETYDSITITNYNRGKAYQIENFATSDGYTINYSKVNQLIQAMASFEADTGMSWTEAVEQGNETATGIVSEMWVKTVS